MITFKACHNKMKPDPTRLNLPITVSEFCIVEKCAPAQYFIFTINIYLYNFTFTRYVY